MSDSPDASPRSVLITGASSGIGAACALGLDALGFRVFAGIRSEEHALALRAQASDRLMPVRLDVTQEEQIQRAKEQIIECLGGTALTALVNNAGIGVAGPLEVLPTSELRRQFEVNVIGVMAVTRAFIPLLRASGGRIINIGSVSGLIASPFMSPYAASKFALEAITDSLRVEFLPFGIKVIMVTPGAIATPIWPKSLEKADESLRTAPSQVVDFYRPAIAVLRRRGAVHGRPARDVARAVARALTAKHPKRRYLVGLDAKLTAWLRWLPAWIRDLLIVSRLPSYGGAATSQGEEL
ncbi:MAG TPA: SDR family oxidoreductase [Anaerolineales bacterium]|nr:SDR family oxidoreductase [Anaerolineales bacterium]